jgi:hypothetical protein
LYEGTIKAKKNPKTLQQEYSFVRFMELINFLSNRPSKKLGSMPLGPWKIELNKLCLFEYVNFPVKKG